MGHCRLQVKQHTIIGDVEPFFFFFTATRSELPCGNLYRWNMDADGKIIIVIDFQSAVSRAFRDGPTYLGEDGVSPLDPGVGVAVHHHVFVVI